MIRGAGLKFLPFLAMPLVGLALLAASGCSDEPTAAVSDAAQPFSKDELAEMRKSVKGVDEYRELLRVKTAERAGSNVVKTKSSAAKKKP